MVKFHSVGGLINYFREVKIELSKVTWPKRNEVIKLTLIVFIISAIVAAYVGGLDLVFTKLLEFLVSR
jgi:preprotein translocase subunit SecE